PALPESTGMAADCLRRAAPRRGVGAVLHAVEARRDRLRAAPWRRRGAVDGTELPQARLRAALAGHFGKQRPKWPFAVTVRARLAADLSARWRGRRHGALGRPSRSSRRRISG